MGALALRPADLREFDGEARVQDLQLGEVLGFSQPVDIRKLIRRHRDRLESHGELFATVARKPGARGRPINSFYLNERQAYRLCMWSDAPNAAAVQEQMVEVFFAWRHGRLVPAGAPTYAYAPPRLRRPNKRSRLCSIDFLPEACAEDVRWMKSELNGRAMHQQDILREFNARIAAHGERPISKSAFSRFAINERTEIKRMEIDLAMTREIIAAIGPGGEVEAMKATAHVLGERLLASSNNLGGGDIRAEGTAALALERLNAIISGRPARSRSAVA